MSDSLLVQAARGGERDAFATLLVRHRPLLLALCRRALGDPGLADDAAQEAALQAMLSLDRLRQPERFGSWLAGIGLNVCRRWRRERSRDAWSWEALIGGRLVAEPIAEGDGPADLIEAADLRAQVQRAVAHLPPGQRAAVTLFYLSGLTHAETAALLGVEVGAVKTRLHKARRSLRRQLWTAWRDQPMTQSHAQESRMVEMRVRDVRRYRAEIEGEHEHEHRHVVMLEEVGGDRVLPIWIGPFEATAIAVHIEGVETPRPLTYAFAADIFQAAGGRLREARISRLAEKVFYAEAVVEGPDGMHAIDARPSDALNLALAIGAPIRVDEAVLTAVIGQEGPPVLDREDFEGTNAIVADLATSWRGSNPRSERETGAE